MQIFNVLNFREAKHPLQKFAGKNVGQATFWICIVPHWFFDESLGWSSDKIFIASKIFEASLQHWLYPTPNRMQSRDAIKSIFRWFLGWIFRQNLRSFVATLSPSQTPNQEMLSNLKTVPSAIDGSAGNHPPPDYGILFISSMLSGISPSIRNCHWLEIILIVLLVIHKSRHINTFDLKHCCLIFTFHFYFQ